MEKPPLGVMPIDLWINHRRLELVRAIYEYVNFDPESKMIDKWSKEVCWLNEIIEKRKLE